MIKITKGADSHKLNILNITMSSFSILDFSKSSCLGIISLSLEKKFNIKKWFLKDGGKDLPRWTLNKCKREESIGLNM